MADYSYEDLRIQEAVWLYRIRAVQDAEKLLKEVLKRNPNKAEAWYGLAMCSNNQDDKRYYLKKVISLKPDHPQANQALLQLEETPTQSKHKDSTKNWEYKIFRYPFTFNNLKNDGQEKLWEHDRDIIIHQLESDYRDGWRPTHTIGPHCIVSSFDMMEVFNGCAALMTILVLISSGYLIVLAPFVLLGVWLYQYKNAPPVFKAQLRRLKSRP